MSPTPTPQELAALADEGNEFISARATTRRVGRHNIGLYPDG